MVGHAAQEQERPVWAFLHVGQINCTGIGGYGGLPVLGLAEGVTQRALYNNLARHLLGKMLEERYGLGRVVVSGFQHRKAQGRDHGQRVLRGNAHQCFPRGGKMVLVVLNFRQHQAGISQCWVHGQRKAQHQAGGLIKLEQVERAALPFHSLLGLLPRLLAEQEGR